MAPLPVTSRRSVLYENHDIFDNNPDQWPNIYIAAYFGLNSIIGINNGEIWEYYGMNKILNGFYIWISNIKGKK